MYQIILCLHENQISNLLSQGFDFKKKSIAELKIPFQHEFNHFNTFQDHVSDLTQLNEIEGKGDPTLLLFWLNGRQFLS